MNLEEALSALAASREHLAQKERQIEELTGAVSGAQATIQKLQHQLEQVLKRLYGRSSEKWDPNQGVFDALMIRAMEEGGAGAPAAEDPRDDGETPQRSRPRHRAPAHGRLPIPDHLRREEVVLDLPEDQKICPVSGRPMICIGYEESEKLEYEPGRLFVRVYKRPKYVSPERHNDQTGVVTSAMPEHPILKCKADAGLLAYVVVSKFADHLPLYRQEGIFAREGVRIPRSTQDGWLLQAADALLPLYRALKKAVLATEVLFTDDTVLRLLEPGRGKTRQARMWVYVRGGDGARLVIYDFTVDRRKERPMEFVGDYRGYVHADAYSGYDALFCREAIIEVGCWSHGRRGFVEAMDSRPREASEMMGHIGGLYQIEREIRDRDPGERLRVRQERAVPRLERLFERTAALVPEATPAEPLRKALNYLVNQRTALRRYTEDGRLEIDNNTAENAIRPLALGRKNYLFAGSERGGQAAALYLSLVESCRQNQVEPWQYFRDLFRRIMAHPVRQLRALLPDTWKAEHAAAPP